MALQKEYITESGFTGNYHRAVLDGIEIKVYLYKDKAHRDTGKNPDSVNLWPFKNIARVFGGNRRIGGLDSD